LVNERIEALPTRTKRIDLAHEHEYRK
jgi:hypothetical protein